MYEICKKTENCVEADYKIINGKEVYNCTRCLNEYVLTYKQKGDIFACKYDENITNNNDDKTNQTGTKTDIPDTESDVVTPGPGVMMQLK